MKSMTGFGQARVQGEEANYEVNVKTVNGRFLETRFHIPREMVFLEPDFKKIISEKFMRGTADVFISRRIKAASSHATVIVNEGLAKEYLKSFTQLSKKLKLSFKPTVELISRQPDVIHVEDSGDSLEKDKKTVLQAFMKAVKACEDERHREGLALRLEMQKLMGQLEEHIAQVSSLREDANKLRQEKYLQRIETRMKSAEIDPQRLMQEIVIQLDKTDINEELQRLEEHIKNYKKLLQSTSAEGKKLDFYTQELLREVNTIGSKSQVAKITQAVVEAKTIIERLREQVQNIE
jgi:uncharacterized protein (TIGR00255 family)